MQSMSLSKRIKELRKVNNYTQDYVASALGVVRQTYSHYETGKRTPNSEILFKLSGLYDIPVEDLMRLTMEIDRNIYYEAPGPSLASESLAAYLDFFNNPKNQKKFQYNTSLEKELLYYFQQIPDSDKKEIIEFTKIKAKKHKDD